jgi:aryl-alcohol dehydrogenase-like predicted oxidoreductase
MFTPRFSRRNLRKVAPFLEELDTIGKPECRTKAQTALAWLLKDPNVVVIPGAKNPRQLDENLGADHCRLDHDELNRLERAYSTHVPGW